MPAPSPSTSHQTACSAPVNDAAPRARAGPTIAPEIATPRLVPVCRRRYQRLDLEWITVCTRLRATGMPIKTIRRYAQLVSAGHGNEQERLALMKAHRADVLAKLDELQENLQLIDHKIDVYQGRVDAGDADRLWAPTR
jgi:DNA-binding transcriptional MerR regulator